MLYPVLLLFCILAGGYFVFRYLTLIHAVETIKKELDDIRRDLTQNQMVHLPLPNKHLAELLCSVNAALEDIQKERQSYEKREREFQAQIENISHDLRTPLTVILGYLKLIKKSGILLPFAQSREQQELTETIAILEQKAEVLNHLVTQFYDYSRLNANDYELSLTQIDIARTLRESIMGNYQLLQQTHLNIDVQIPDHPVWTLGETAACERIFLNLFQNAGRYADTIFQIYFIEPNIAPENEWVSIFFQNDTRTLTEEDISHLFERFYIQDSSRSQGGTGLGLTVARSLAEQMGGQLMVTAKKSVDHTNDMPDGTEQVQYVCFELRLKRIILDK